MGVLGTLNDIESETANFRDSLMVQSVKSSILSTNPVLLGSNPKIFLGVLNTQINEGK